MLKRKAKKQLSTTSDEKLMLFISIVSRGLSAPVLKIFQKCDVSGQFVLTGEGTTRKEIRNILGLEDNEKDVVISFVRKDKVEELKSLLEVFFISSKRNAGISFSIELDSIIGVKVYQFLADTVREAK